MDRVNAETGGLRVKICGLTRVEDARGAVEAGASLLGFNFYPLSPRYIAPQTCNHLLEDLRVQMGTDLNGVLMVGVFVNAIPADIRSILDGCGLDLAQLSGDEPASELSELGERAYKVIRPDGRLGGEILTGLPSRQTAPAALVDAAVSGHFGGTGKLADWDFACEMAGQAPILLAGGLTADNVGEAVRTVRPWGVDVASGVESAPGKKDAEKMRRFVQAAVEADREIAPERGEGEKS